MPRAVMADRPRAVEGLDRDWINRLRAPADPRGNPAFHL